MAEWIEPLHCTAYYDVSGDDVNYANEVQNALVMEFNIKTAELWMGKIQLEVKFTQQCDLMYQLMNITAYYINCHKRDTEQRRLDQ